MVVNVIYFGVKILHLEVKEQEQGFFLKKKAGAHSNTKKKKKGIGSTALDDFI